MMSALASRRLVGRSRGSRPSWSGTWPRSTGDGSTSARPARRCTSMRRRGCTYRTPRRTCASRWRGYRDASGRARHAGRGRLHLSAIAKLAPHLREDNHEALLARAVPSVEARDRDSRRRARAAAGCAVAHAPAARPPDARATVGAERTLSRAESHIARFRTPGRPVRAARRRRRAPVDAPCRRRRPARVTPLGRRLPRLDAKSSLPSRRLVTGSSSRRAPSCTARSSARGRCFAIRSPMATSAPCSTGR